ncbi:putative glycosyltransferase [Microbacterium sp. HM58-2]|nr:putative glycosyltransferase [Microbacterium sp. HM58-2]
MTEAPASRTALVLSFSDIASDPRVRREIDWLEGDGWTVDTLGFGVHPAPSVNDHFVLGDQLWWVRGRVGVLLVHLLLPARLRFRALMRSRIPRALRERVRAGHYDLIVFNELEFAPWVEDRGDFTTEAMLGLRHLDLHEYHNPDMRRRNLGGKITSSQYRWGRRHIGSRRFTSRTVVNTPIGRLYAEEFGIPVPAEVRNAPPYVQDLVPSDVAEDDIRLLFHGLPSWARGFQEILAALRELPPRFSMTFMLTSNPVVHEMLRQELSDHPARDRIRIVPPAPMREIAQRINEYDVEIVFYRPTGINLQYAMPNKFFEAAQGRLALIVGETETMAPIVREYGHGVVVPEFTWESLRDTLALLDAAQVAEMKERSAVVAREINSEGEGRAFLAAIHAGSIVGDRL